MAVTLAETLLVALGGATGSVARFLIQQSALISPKTYNTLAVNLAGCLAIGIIWAIASHLNMPEKISRFMVSGFLGGFTTFSAFALDAVSMAAGGRLREAIAYTCLSTLGGLLLCFLGMRATESVINL